MQLSPYAIGVRPRPARFWPRRVVLVGGDSVVSRALLVFLHKEGFDAAVVSEDPSSWTAELAGRPFGAAPDGAARVAHGGVDVIVVSPHVTGNHRTELCRRVRATRALHDVPIVTLRDAGDVEHAPRAGGLAGLAPAPGAESGDASIAWPFRLREVLSTIDGLTGRAVRATA